ncbi:PorT family protein [Bacteroidales bacterium OttesenSCG-928-B11]|nr:PorT family protein [Bacteroidales bacterium OttesenSCG-928-E04]MDL2308700.1 PorT family protein [Bacteroidales bacterium OttesenSCG-928-C03]MDL2311945.1 PorT family protein [Bacteroidales bacterium OttesenSCG-928-B11]
MKKIIILCAILLACSHLFSQGSGIRGGVRAGATTSQISGDDLSGFHKLGAYAGVFANIPFPNERWKFQMELNFIMKGSSRFVKASDDPNAVQKYVLNLFYIELPLLIKYNAFRNFDIELGPTINFLMGSREVDLGGQIMGRPPFRFFEFCILGGVSYSFNEHWSINLRYTNSIIPVRIPDWAYYRSVKKQFNSAFALSGVFQF